MTNNSVHFAKAAAV